MKHLAAYILLVLGGNEAPKVNTIRLIYLQSADVKKLLESVGVEADSSRLDSLIESLQGKNLDEIMAEGKKKLSSVPAAGAAVASGNAPAGGAAKEEAKKEESEEETGNVGGLFDDDDDY